MIYPLFSQTSELLGYESEECTDRQEPEELRYFRLAYRDVQFAADYDEEKDDWKITAIIDNTTGKRTVVLYWADGALLPEEELANRVYYDTVLYDYHTELPDPADFTDEHRLYLKNQGNRVGSSLMDPVIYLFDVLYDADTRRNMENHTVKISFLGFKIVVHEEIVDELEKVEHMIMTAAETDAEVKDYVRTLQNIGAYNWRSTRGYEKRSFHSYGVALDLTPSSYGGKACYWQWSHDFYPDTWMNIALNKRWTPPEAVIEAFAVNGFIWGGNWDLWDNMHFEYRPELLLYKRTF